MPKNIQKAIRDYISKIKIPRSQIHLPSKKWIPKGCKHIRTHSFSLDDKRNRAHGSGKANNNNNKKNDNEATLADIDRFLFDNFRSLFLGDVEESDNNNTQKVINDTKIVSDEESHGKAPIPSPTPFEDPSTDLYESRRFFATGGFSGSQLETTTTKAGSSRSNSTIAPCSKETITFPNNYVAVMACSKSPQEEFKRSMDDMVEAGLRNDEKVDWDFMEELLFRYMNINEKRSHKFILAAFVDVVTGMRLSPKPAPKPAPEKPQSVRTVRVKREIRKKTEEVTLEFESS